MSALTATLGKALTRNILLKKYSTFKIGGPAKYFFIAKNETDLIKAITAARQDKIPYYILGSGANVLIADEGVDGLVIVAKNDQLTTKGDLVRAGAGVTLGKLVHTAIKEGLTGIECWSGIPGTVGGSIYGNMGLPQVPRGEISDWLESVTVLRGKEKLVLNNSACKFNYRDSIFKHNQDIILNASFRLHKSHSLAESKKLVQDYQEKKLASQPVALPSCGCMFKNPPGHSAGQMIDALGLKGMVIGQAQISPRHANFINNLGEATAADVVMLISLIKQRISDRYHLQLEEEVNYIGF